MDGFDRSTLGSLSHHLDGLIQARPAFVAGHLPRSGVHWVRPELVAQVTFSEWTADGHLRHPALLGLREDKDPYEVVREEPRRAER